MAKQHPHGRQRSVLPSVSHDALRGYGMHKYDFPYTYCRYDLVDDPVTDSIVSWGADGCR